MKTLISFVLMAIILCVVKADSKSKVKLLRFENIHGTDKYNFGYATSDGTSRDETGNLKTLGSGKKAMSVKGSYSFIADNGVRYTVHYIADENGYRAKQTSSLDPITTTTTTTKRPIISISTVNKRPILQLVPSLGIPPHVLESLLG